MPFSLTRQMLKALAFVTSIISLAGCELSDHLTPNPDAQTLYSEPYLGLKQLNSTQSRLLPQAAIDQLKGTLNADDQRLAAYSGKLAPEAASLVLNPPRDIERLTEADTAISVLGDAQLAQLARRQRDTDLELGIYREARIRAEQIAAQRAAVEEARAEQAARVAEANAALAGELLPKREIESVPQPQSPSELRDLFRFEGEGERPLAILYFASGSAELGPREEVVVRATARQLAGRGWQIFVRGYDSGSLANRTRADRARSLLLSQQRAKAVTDLLIEAGMSAAEINSQGVGDQAPIFPEISDVGVFGNQRVQITGISPQQATQN